MPKYSYIARDAQGKKVKGAAFAESEAELYETLRGGGQFLLSCRDEEKSDKKRRKLKTMQLSDFCRQLGTLLSSGISLVRALHMIEEDETVKPEQKAIYADILRLVRQGESFSDSMAAQKGAFPELLINMFRSAEQTGSLDKTAMRMAEHYQKEYRLNSKVKSAMMYPKILGVVIFAVVMIIFTFVMPELMKIFKDMELPALTKAIMALSGFIQRYWLLVILAAAGLIVGIRLIMQVPSVRLTADKWELKLPVVGKLMKVIYTARFARTLCSLYTSGIPIVTAMQVGKHTVGNKYLESQFDDAISRIRRGETLASAIDSIDGFHKKLSGSIAIGEETGSLDSMLTSIAETLDYDAEQALSKLVGYLEPVMIIIMALIVGMIMVSVMMPLVNMYSEIESSAAY